MVDNKNILLKVKNISKSFPGVKALKNVSIKVKENEIVGLVGENGAGKTTFLKIVIGLLRTDKGEMFLNGQQFKPINVKEANMHGISMVFQDLSLVTNLTVSQNLFFGNEKQFIKYGVINWRKMNKDAREILENVGVDINPMSYIKDSNFANRQMIEIAKAFTLSDHLNKGNLLILLDEPTTRLSKREVEFLFKKIELLKVKGASFIFVSHRLDEVLDISDRIYVFKDGEVVGNFDTKSVDYNLLYNLMVGRTIKGQYYKQDQQRGYSERCVLSINGLTKKGSFYDVSFKLHKEEILGICGLLGSGKEELCSVLAGINKADKGEIIIESHAYKFSSPADAIRAGIAYIPKERDVEGIIGILSIADNVCISNLSKVKKMGLISKIMQRDLTNRWISDLKIRCTGPEEPVMFLSGGNQQKVLFCKILLGESKIFILNHPTRGIDVGAKEEIYQVIRDIVKHGASVIILSDTLEESIGLSDTIIVMKDGHIKKIMELTGDSKPKQVDVLKYMI